MKRDDTLIGLRDDDLSPQERAVRDAALADDPDLRADAVAVRSLARELAGLSLPPPRPPPMLPTVAHASPVRWVAGGALIAAAAGLLVVGVPAPGVRARGGGSVGETVVVLRAVAESSDGAVRALSPGDVVHPDERVIFDVQAPAQGSVTVVEGGAVVWPLHGTWQVDGGRHLVGGDRPQAWRPDPGVVGPQTYRATWCDAEGACADDVIELTWESP